MHRHLPLAASGVVLVLIAAPVPGWTATAAGGKVTIDLRLKLQATSEAGKFIASGTITDSGTVTLKDLPITGTKYAYGILTLRGKKGTIRTRVRVSQATDRWLTWTIASGSGAYVRSTGQGTFPLYVVNGPFIHVVMRGVVSR